jgi:hypothetical protein
VNTTVTPASAIQWLQVIALLVQTGKLAVVEIGDAIKKLRGENGTGAETDETLAAEDNAMLAAVHMEIARRYEQAARDAAGA